MVNRCHDSLCAHWTRSAIGFRFIAFMAFLAAIWVLTNSPSQKYACRSKSTVRDSRRAMSPSSSEESFMMSDQLLPAAHASITPAPPRQHQHQPGLAAHAHLSLPVVAEQCMHSAMTATYALCMHDICTALQIPLLP